MTAIDLKHRAVRRDRADADVFAEMLPSAHDAERIYFGRFRRPEARVGDEELRLLPLLAGDLPFSVQKSNAAGLIAGEADDARAPAHVAFDLVVVKMPLFAAQQVDVAEEPAHAELILPFKIGTRAPLHDDDADGIFPRLQKGGDVELRA